MSDLLSQDEIDALLHGVDDVEEDEDLGLFSLEPQAETLMPLVPSLGIRWQF